MQFVVVERPAAEQSRFCCLHLQENYIQLLIMIHVDKVSKLNITTLKVVLKINTEFMQRLNLIC